MVVHIARLETLYKVQGLESPLCRMAAHGAQHPSQGSSRHQRQILTTLTSSATAQRSAQELPLVEKQSTDSYPVIGGKKMVLSGHNFLQDSKVIFVEKAPGMFSRMVGEHLFCCCEPAPGQQDIDSPPA